MHFVVYQVSGGSQTVIVNAAAPSVLINIITDTLHCKYYYFTPIKHCSYCTSSRGNSSFIHSTWTASNANLAMCLQTLGTYNTYNLLVQETNNLCLLYIY